jgi:hypothetical protein
MVWCRTGLVRGFRISKDQTGSLVFGRLVIEARDQSDGPEPVKTGPDCLCAQLREHVTWVSKAQSTRICLKKPYKNTTEDETQDRDKKCMLNGVGCLLISQPPVMSPDSTTM